MNIDKAVKKPAQVKLSETQVTKLRKQGRKYVKDHLTSDQEPVFENAMELTDSTLEASYVFEGMLEEMEDRRFNSEREA